MPCIFLDLALSVTMTAISTIVAIVMLPLNLMIYSKLAFNQADNDFVNIIDFGPLFTSLIVVFAAISLGIVATDKIDSHKFNVRANGVSRIPQLLKMIFGFTASDKYHCLGLFSSLVTLPELLS